MSADLAEQVVVDAVRELLAGVSGSATVADGVAEAEREVEDAEQLLDASVRAFNGLEDVEAARERLGELREQRDVARERLAELRAAAVQTVRVTASEDWDVLTLDERRAIVRAVVERATSLPDAGRTESPSRRAASRRRAAASRIRSTLAEQNK